MARQPFFIKKTGIEGALPNGDVIHYNGCYVPNHQSMTEEDVLKICKIINEI
jgi:dTDP-4-amino-4,6-dideoxygalactose transaminase